jgi:YVTN family beta-propeller protein
MRPRDGKVAATALLALAIAACVPVDMAPSVGTEPAAPSALFVAGKRGNTLSRIDLVTGTEAVRVPSCLNPHELATSPDGRHVALACYGGWSVDIFRTDTLEKVASITVGRNARPHGIVWHPGGAIYVTTEARQSIFRITAPLSAEPDLAEFPTRQQGSHMIVVAPDESVAWTTDLGSRTVTRIRLVPGFDPQSVTVGEEPEGIALSPDGKTLWVSARGSDEAYALDPQTMAVRETVATGRFPLRIAVRPQGDVAVTSDLEDGSLSVIDTATARRIRTIPVSSPAEAQTRFQVTILWSADGDRIYVAETGTDTVAEVDYASGKVLRRFKTGEGGDGMAILP